MIDLMLFITAFLMTITAIIAIDASVDDRRKRWKFGLLSVGFGVISLSIRIFI